MKSKIRTLWFAVILTGFPFLACAQDQGGFIGASIGTADDEVLNEDESGFKLFGGYRFTRNIAGEIAFVDLGSYFGGFLDQYGLAFDVMVILPVADNFEFFAKAGLFSWTVETPFADDDGTDLMYGLGAQFNVNRNIGLRIEYEEFTDVSGGDVSLISAGVSYHF